MSYDKELGTVLDKIMDGPAKPKADYSGMTRTEIFKSQAAALAANNQLTEEKKKQIVKLFFELGHQNPKWKAHRCMRKAAEHYHVKIDFE